MSGTKSTAMLASISPRPALKSQQSTSLPSTPNQRPRDRVSPSRSPSAKRNTSNPSPRSLHSDSLPLPPQRPRGGCKYETGMAYAKRRVPYSLGPDKLDADPEVPKAVLSTAEDARLTGDMRELYNRLLPSQESEERRKRLVEKLKLILKTQWPGYKTKVNVFGSTGNKLGSTDSDVDICITTDCKELEQVCVLADFLATQGMQRVVCVSVAKVPIVKIWDPDLKLACDMNVNNPVALENTEMIRTYVEIDQRVQPLAMIIKHWTKRRVLNEAGRCFLPTEVEFYANQCTALGGTLSSYTWICMIINFLQTRDPPILPALQQSPFIQKKFMSGLNVAFDKSITSHRGYGSNNKDSLGGLLFQFFRYYGHEIDFETSVMSVRAGKVVSKLEKNWHFLQDNRLCVEEPFNTSRNLGNTADDTSVRGIHLELRRAFQMVSEANLGRCCDEYEPPANLVDAPRPLERQNASVNRPTLTPHTAATSGRAGRGGSRGGRQNNQFHRNSNPGRRASSASTRGLPFSQPASLSSNITQTELSLQAQHQQYLLHDRLFQQYQFLQAQEQGLRAQLHQQAVLQGRMIPTSTYPHFLLPYGAYAGSQEELMRARAGTINQPHLTAPVRPHGFSFPSSYGGRSPGYGTTTNPPSPLLNTILPDSRRSYRRSSLTHGSSGASLRAHSQPPRPVPSPLSFSSATDNHHEHMPGMQQNPVRGPSSTSTTAQEFVDAMAGAQGRLYQNLSTDRRGSEYIGYYLGHSPPLPTYQRSVVGSPFICSTGLGIQNGGISPQVLAQLPSNPLSIPPFTSDLTLSTSVELQTTKSEPLEGLPLQDASRRPHNLSSSSSGPVVVVNGSVIRDPECRQSIINLRGSLSTSNFDTSASDDVAVETPTSSDDCSQGLHGSEIAYNESIPDQDSHITTKEPSEKEKRSKNPMRQVNGHTDLSYAGRLPKLSVGPLSMENQSPRVNGADRALEPTAASDAVMSQIIVKTFQTQALQLSPVKEVRTPSPTKSRGSSIPRDSAQGASKPKSKGKAKQKKSSLSSIDLGEGKAEALASQPNGLSSSAQAVNPTGNMGSASGWQTQKKKSKHRKSSKSETDLKGLNSAGGEFLPLEESLRKGG